MSDVACHEVDEERIAHALDDIRGRAYGRWHALRYDSLSLTGLQAMADELLDHVAARSLADPALAADTTREVLRTAAECALGALNLGCFPNGDFEIPLPVVDETLSSEDLGFEHALEWAPTARTWVEAFALCVAAGTVRQWQRVIGLLLRGDYAPAIRDGVPYSALESRSEAADLAEMDALCGYLTEASGHLPKHWPTAPLRKPDLDERLAAIRRLGAVGPLTPDQQLLRVLLVDDRPAFERALAERLQRHRADMAAADPAPRSLLPAGTIALAALAVQVHGWDLELSSGYLPEGLLRGPEGVPRAAV
ncbi:immunity 49 family protein [Streptomyces sp. NPDC006314]|uniref:immunity 49 family protein n=1 Tax=Streptomyces sp. NPDC006314 TaxID=3154475 RepID=UPI0033AC1233